jgi:hypothetical protein
MGKIRPAFREAGQAVYFLRATAKIRRNVKRVPHGICG